MFAKMITILLNSNYLIFNKRYFVTKKSPVTFATGLFEIRLRTIFIVSTIF
jgi:hypothetical protein